MYKNNQADKIFAVGLAFVLLIETYLFKQSLVILDNTRYRKTTSQAQKNSESEEPFSVDEPDKNRVNIIITSIGRRMTNVAEEPYTTGNWKNFLLWPPLQFRFRVCKLPQSKARELSDSIYKVLRCLRTDPLSRPMSRTQIGSPFHECFPEACGLSQQLLCKPAEPS